MIVKRKPSTEGLLERLSKRRIVLPPVSLPIGSATDHGIVIELPKSPTVGDTCRFLADKTNGILWPLVYTGEGELPWWADGEPKAIVAKVDTEETVKATAYSSEGLTALLIKAPLKGDYDAVFGFNGYFEPAADESVVMGLDAGGGAADAESCEVHHSAKIRGGSTSRSVRKTGVAAGTAITAKHKVSAGTGKIRRRWMRLTPVRVG